jgi:hypothetical protein
MQFEILLWPLCKMVVSTLDKNNYMHFFHPCLKSSHRHVDIVFIKNGIHTLIYIVIANRTHVDLHPQSYTIQIFATSNATQAKERSYHNQHPIDQFLPLAIEIFGCLYK